MTSKVNEKTWVQKMEECLVKERKNGLTGNPQLSVVHGVSTENINHFSEHGKYRGFQRIIMSKNIN